MHLGKREDEPCNHEDSSLVMIITGCRCRARRPLRTIGSASPDDLRRSIPKEILFSRSLSRSLSSSFPLPTSLPLQIPQLDGQDQTCLVRIKRFRRVISSSSFPQRRRSRDFSWNRPPFFISTLRPSLFSCSALYRLIASCNYPR